jgi:predicted O-methyltransferase YrrM
MQLSELYKIAKEHKDTHLHCGAEPYLDYEYLFSFIKNRLSSGSSLSKEVDTNEVSAGGFLELGTGIGFTALVMSLANKSALIDTIETNTEHIEYGKNWCRELGISNINFIQSDVHKVLPYLESTKYDFIFFDVYGPKEKFITDFERILRPGGVLYSVNSHLKSAEQNYFDHLNKSSNWELLDKFNDTVIYKKLS